MPDACVVDTDVVSYLFKRDTRAEACRSYLVGAVPLVSFMAIAELERWALQSTSGAARRRSFATFIEQHTIVYADRDLCRTWARIADRTRRRGRPIPVADAWIAATAIAPGVPLPTNDRSDFAGVPDPRLLPDRTA